MQTSIVNKRSHALLHPLYAITADLGQGIIVLCSYALVFTEILQPGLCPSKDNTRDPSRLVCM